MSDFNWQQRARNTLDDELNEIHNQVEAMLSESSISSSATADNLPGAGRTLGKLFMFLGRRLEAAASRFMEKHGYGPEAARKRLRMLCYKRYYTTRAQRIPIQGTVEYRKSRNDVKKLLKYVRSQYASNQELALKAILDLAVYDDIRKMLLELDAAKMVGFVLHQAELGDCDQLLSSSRKALISLVETDINMSGKELVGLHHMAFPGFELQVLRTRLTCILQTFEATIQSSEDVSFLAVRYFREYSMRSCVCCVTRFLPTTFLKIPFYLLEHAPHAIEWPVFAEMLWSARWILSIELGVKELHRELMERSLRYIPYDYKERFIQCLARVKCTGGSEKSSAPLKKEDGSSLRSNRYRVVRVNPDHRLWHAASSTHKN
ncbi:hypothetical protein DFH11DRAFT_993494 [Phellopilus nigrolimitatus]|nr:hypothetical protein DFH11DRAFT_993494 [Phellopilus nigrolimitatus]